MCDGSRGRVERRGRQAAPEDPLIQAAFPTRSGRHEEYGEAMRMVGARYSKGGLVALVHWLLCQVHDACEAAVEPNEELLKLREVVEAARPYLDALPLTRAWTPGEQRLSLAFAKLEAKEGT